MEYTEDNKVKFVLPSDAQEYLMLEEAKREASKPMTEEEKLHDRVRRKMIGELYYQLGITDEYVAKKKAWLDKQRRKNPEASDSGKTLVETIDEQQKVAGGAGGSANADRREVISNGKEIVAKVAPAAVLAMGGMEVIGPAVLGEAAYATVAGAVASITAAPFFGPVVLAETVGVLLYKIIKKAKSRKANLADQAQKLDDFEKDLKELVAQLQVLQARLDKDHDMVYEQFMAYKNGDIKKKDFDAFVADYTASILGEMNIESKHPPKKGKKSVAKVNTKAVAKGVIKPAPTDDHTKNVPDVDVKSPETEKSLAEPNRDVKPQDAIVSEIESEELER